VGLAVRRLGLSERHAVEPQRFRVGDDRGRAP
jgi:hypothetical protein